MNMVTLMMLKPLVFIVSLTSVLCAKDEENQVVIPPTNCEVCKYLAAELRDRLVETGKNKEVMATGHGLEPRKKKFKYNTSELRLIEALTEPHVCDEMLKYNVHKQRKGSLRFAKGRSETFEKLQKLVNRGVNIKLMDFPYELWNDTTAEVTQMHKRCFHLVEQFEDEIEDWYYSNQDRDIVDFLCRDTVLKGDDQRCLDEVYVPKGESGDDDDDEDDDDEDDDEVEKKNKKKPKSDKAEKKGKKNKKDKPKQKGDSSKKDKKSKHAKKEEL